MRLCSVCRLIHMQSKVRGRIDQQALHVIWTSHCGKQAVGAFRRRKFAGRSVEAGMITHARMHMSLDVPSSMYVRSAVFNDPTDCRQRLSVLSCGDDGRWGRGTMRAAP
jgi:hypothetical protein